MKLTGGQILAKALKAHGVQYVAGIPGYGSWAMVDAFLEPGSEIPFIQVMQEQSAVHLADGFFRACGRPMAALLPAGLETSKAVCALATASANSSAVLVLSGDKERSLVDAAKTASRGDRATLCKVDCYVNEVDAIPAVLRQAFVSMLSGRPGPASLALSVSAQIGTSEAKLDFSVQRQANLKSCPDAQVVSNAAALLCDAQRPVILVGGGVINADVTDELVKLAEYLHAPVVSTSGGKGAFPDDHALNGGAIGRLGSTCGNCLLSSADLILAVGTRLENVLDLGWGGGRDSALAHACLVHIDIDAKQIGKRHDVDLAIVADAKLALDAIGSAITAAQRTQLATRRAPYLKEIIALRQQWDEQVELLSNSDCAPFNLQRPLLELRNWIESDAIIVVGSGGVKGAVHQMFPIYHPRTHLTCGDSSSLGWAVPAAIGARLAMPARQVICLVGDGDFLHSLQELAVCVMHTIPVLFVVFNNSGYMSLRDGQNGVFGRHYGCEFNFPDGKPYFPHYAEVARNFGLDAWRVEHASQLKSVYQKALKSNGPSLVEVIVAREGAGPVLQNDLSFPAPQYAR